MENNKKEFFDKLTKLPLEEKIAVIVEKAQSPEQKKEAQDLIVLLIHRARSVGLRQKISLMRQYLTKEKANNNVIFLLNEERRKRKKAKAENLPDTLSLEEFFKRDATFSIRNTKKVLEMAAAYLTRKQELGEKVGPKDCAAIELMLNVSHYHTYRDQMNRIARKCFDFQGQNIKKIAFNFLDQVLTKDQSIEVRIFFNLLEGNYLSKEMYSILAKHINLIADTELLPCVIDNLKRIHRQDKQITFNKKKKMVALIAKYENALRQTLN